MRILITGSRDVDERLRVTRPLMRYINSTCPMLVNSEGNPIRRDTSDVVIIHGAARGVDQIAASWAEGCDPPIATQAYPVTEADWREHPHTAGYIRNIQMVRAGADVCMAFIAPCRKTGCERSDQHGTHGASHTADIAEAAGIHTIRIDL